MDIDDTSAQLKQRVTQLEREVKQLQSINRSLNAAVENSPAAIVITDKRGVIEYVNSAFTTYTGYTEEEAIGMHTRVFNSGTHSNEYYQAMWKALASGMTWKDAFCNRRKNGELYWEQQFISPIKNEKGEIEHYSSVKVDITTEKNFEDRLRASESYLRAITKAIPELFFVVNEDGRILDVISSDERQLYEQSYKIKGLKISDIMPQPISLKFMDIVRKTLDTREIQSLEYELEVIGGLRWFEGRSAPLDITVEGKKCIVYVARDITDRKDYEKELKQLIATKDKFFSIIAHDLKNPFNALLGISELLYTNPTGFDLIEIRDLSKLINESSRNAYELLENLLQWSKAQTGQINFKPALLNLKELVENSVRVIESQAHTKNININIRIGENMQVFADNNLLKTIIRNLVSNSVKFTHTGGNINIIARNAKNGLTITVEDTGIGMDTETIHQLFRIDTKYSTLGTSEEKGTGLGLILCKEFIEMHKGLLTVESTVGIGSKFNILLPAN